MARRKSRHRVDVLVAGGGIAGVFAALGSARRGLDVALIEPHNVLGGQGTAGGVNGFCGDTARVNAVFDELLDRLGSFRGVAAFDPLAGSRKYWPEYLAFCLQEMVLERRIDLYVHSRVVGATTKAGRILALDVAVGDELHTFRPRFVIDATGTAAVAAAGGFRTVNEGPGKQLPMGLCFSMIDTGRPVRPVLPPGCPRYGGPEEIPMTTIYPRDDGRAIDVKMKVVGFDAAEGAGFSQAELHARRQMMGLVYYLQTVGYGGRVYRTFRLQSVSRQLGVRQGRQIVGEYTLTEDDVTHAAVFDDAVAVGTYQIDYHWPDKAQRAGTGIIRMVEPYQIPLGSLIPKGAKNLLVAGMCLSADQMAMSSARVMATCAQTGYAAGKAAAMCVRQKVAPVKLNVQHLRRALSRAGQRLDLSAYGQYRRDRLFVHEHVFGDDRPFRQAHASSLVQLPNNRILVAWFGGTREGHRDVAIWLAERFRGRWSAPRRVAKVRTSPHWNPVLFAAPNGRVYLFFKVGETIPAWETWVMVSRDQGQTWTRPRPLVRGDRGGRGPVKNKPIVLSDGVWLAGASLEYQRDGKSRWDVFVDRSEDGGKTWRAGELIPRGAGLAGPGVIQPTLWESSPGRVHMLMRSTDGHICRSDSGDGGKTWSPVRKTSLTAANSGLDVAKLAGGVLALAYNPVPGRRTPLRIALSFDNGRTWPNGLDIETNAGEYSYPAIIPVEVGMAVTYTWRRERVAFWLGSIERVLREGKGK